MPTRPGASPPPANPWRTRSSRPVYDNPWISVREDEVVRADGSPGIYGVVSMAAAVGVVALTEDDEVVLVGQWRYALDEYSWELPEGGADAGESPQAAAARELAEEAGYAARDWSELVGDLAVSNSVTDQRSWLFLARGLEPVPVAPDPTEALEIASVPVVEALEMIDTGLITDALTVIGLLTLDRRRRGGAGDATAATTK